jgi:hypothetical protein
MEREKVEDRGTAGDGTWRVTSRPSDTLGRNSRRSPETEDSGGKLLAAYVLRGVKGLSK